MHVPFRYKTLEVSIYTSKVIFLENLNEFTSNDAGRESQRSIIIFYWGLLATKKNIETMQTITSYLDGNAI